MTWPFDPMYWLFLLVFILIVALPAYYMNRFLLRIIQPKKSVPNFLLYVCSSLIVAFAYALLGVFAVKILLK